MNIIQYLKESDWAWSVLSICTVIGVPLSIFFGIKSLPKKKKLLYNTTTNPLITNSMSNIDGLYVSIDGIQIENLSSTTIVFSNMGKDNIDFSDFSTEKPLCINIQNGTFANLKDIDNYVSEKHLKNDNHVNCSKLSDSQIKIDFEFLKPRDNFKVIFLHTGAVEVQGIPIKGVFAPIEIKKINPLKKLIVINLFAFILITLMLIGVLEFMYPAEATFTNLSNFAFASFLTAFLSTVISVLIDDFLLDS